MSPEKALPGSQASALPMGSVHRAIQVALFLFVSSTSVCPGETPGEKKMMLTNSKAMTMTMLTNSMVMTMTMSVAFPNRKSIIFDNKLDFSGTKLAES